MPSVEIVHDDEALRIVTWSRILANRWRVTPDQQQLEVLGRHQRALIEAIVDRRVVVITVLEPEVGMLLNSAARNEAEAIARDGRDHLLALAQVVEGEGFVAAAARAVMSGVQLAVRSQYPTKVFGRFDHSLRWAAEQLTAAGYEEDAAGLVDALSEALTKPAS